MKKSLIALCVLAAGLACAAVASVKEFAAVRIAEPARELVALAVRTVSNAVNRAIVEYQLLNGFGSMGLITRAPTFTGQAPVRVQPVMQECHEVPIAFDFPAANPANGDALALIKVPAGVDIVDWSLIVDDADSNGAPTLVFSLGSLNAALTALTTTYAAAQTTAQTGGIIRAATTAHFLESSAAERTIGLLFTAAAATYVAGKKGLLVLNVRG